MSMLNFKQQQKKAVNTNRDQIESKSLKKNNFFETPSSLRSVFFVLFSFFFLKLYIALFVCLIIIIIIKTKLEFFL